MALLISETKMPSTWTILATYKHSKGAHFLVILTLSRKIICQIKVVLENYLIVVKNCKSANRNFKYQKMCQKFLNWQSSFVQFSFKLSLNHITLYYLSRIWCVLYQIERYQYFRFFHETYVDGVFCSKKIKARLLPLWTTYLDWFQLQQFFLDSFRMIHFSLFYQLPFLI